MVDFSTCSGKYIYHQIQKLIEEERELADATDMVGDSLGQDSSACLILNNAYKEKVKELKRYEEQVYSVQ